MTTPPDLSAWDRPPPAALRRLDGGTNNTLWLVDDSYVLRRYQNLDPARVAAEHRLLAVLAEPGRLPFAVPVPVTTRDGGTLATTTEGPAALFPFLPGRLARRRDLADLALAGEALGTLDAALADLPAALAPTDWRRPLDAVHPAVPDLPRLWADLARALPGDARVARLPALARDADREYHRLLDTLPTQIVHGDLSLGNVLVDRGRVAAVLDFEVAGLDLRVADLVAAFAMDVDWGTSDAAAQQAALRDGYRRTVELRPAEEAAVPTLLRYRRLGSLIWRAGRWRQGLATLDEVRERVLALDDAIR